MKKFILLLLLCLPAGLIIAQNDTTKVQLITLTDGSEFRGRINFEDSTHVSFTTISGTSLNVERKQIKNIEEQSGAWTDGEFLLADPNQTRLFFSPTGRSLKGGEGYFSTYEIFFPSVAVGLTDYIMLSGGVSLIPGADRQMYYFAPKIRPFHSGNFDFSTGLLIADMYDYSFGILYGTFSAGSTRASFTGSLGLGFANGEFAERPMVMLGGELQLSNHLKLITENWMMPGEDGAIISLGLRFFGTALSADLALVTETRIVDKSSFPFIPWIGFSYSF